MRPVAAESEHQGNRQPDEHLAAGGGNRPLPPAEKAGPGPGAEFVEVYFGVLKGGD